MHLVISGLNGWSFGFLTAALLSGFLHASWHINLGLLASLIAVLSQSAVFALFIGAAKTLKETVRLYGLPGSYIERANRVYFGLFPWAVGTAMATVCAAVLGGLAGRSPAYRWIHAGVSLLAYGVMLAAAPLEHLQLRRMHQVLADMSAAVGPQAERTLEGRRANRSAPGNAGEETGRRQPAAARETPDPRARGKAILTLSGLGLVTLLGYRYAAGAVMSDLTLVLLALPLLAFAALGLYTLARGAHGGKS
jgi:hypothetical protein